MNYTAGSQWLLGSSWGARAAFRQRDQLGQLFLREVAQLPRVAIADVLVDRGQQVPPLGRQPDQHHAAVVGRTLALDQAALLELVDQPGNVGGPGNQPRGQGQRGQLAVSFAAQ